MFTFHFIIARQRLQLEDFNVVPYIFIIIFAMLFAELLGYLNMRTQVKLKLNMHIMQLHQGQFIDLLDSVPDAVMISELKEAH